MLHTSEPPKRRRERHHRAYLKYVRMTVAMALAESTHHQRNARAGTWVRDILHGEVPGQPTSQQELFQLFEEKPGGSRHPVWVSRGGCRRRSSSAPSEQLADVAPMVQILDTPGLLGDQVVEVLRKLDVPAVEQVIAVPKISLDRVPQRSAIRRPQKAERWW